MSTIQAIRGMNDILPSECSWWQQCEQVFRELAQSYAYQEIRLPLMEYTSLFLHAIGEVTDIVEKEMYTFRDKNDESITLRPEGTASCVRAGIQHGLLYNQVQRWWYHGPMFRYERPQKGRYRQFHQFGVEVFGCAGPVIDAELILFSRRLWQRLGITPYLNLQINSLGTLEARNQYKETLVEYLQQHYAQLDEDSKNRLAKNPLRILDSKNPQMQTIIQNAPKLTEHLDAESAEEFAQLCAILDRLEVSYTVNPYLVRGLDYYGKTVFEWVSDHLGAQGTVCAGGRYDSLVQAHGGKDTPAVGFAIGQERLVLLLQQTEQEKISNTPQVFVIIASPDATAYALQMTERLREQCPSIALMVNCHAGSLKSQFKRADKSGAEIALIIGEEEMHSNTISIKHLREQQAQQRVSFEALCAQLKG
jgi:histidyl-tRNA synthetase